MSKVQNTLRLLSLLLFLLGLILSLYPFVSHLLPLFLLAFCQGTVTGILVPGLLLTRVYVHA